MPMLSYKRSQIRKTIAMSAKEKKQRKIFVMNKNREDALKKRNEKIKEIRRKKKYDKQDLIAKFMICPRCEQHGDLRCGELKTPKGWRVARNGELICRECFYKEKRKTSIEKYRAQIYPCFHCKQRIKSKERNICKHCTQEIRREVLHIKDFRKRVTECYLLCDHSLTVKDLVAITGYDAFDIYYNAENNEGIVKHGFCEYILSRWMRKEIEKERKAMSDNEQ